MSSRNAADLLEAKKMKRHHGQDIRIKRGMIRALGVLVVALFIASPCMCWAEMTVMTDAELSEVTGAGYSEFTLEDGVALARLDIRATTYTEIDSMKLAYYNNGTGLGWDENWTGVKLGSESADLDMRGLFIRCEFENVCDAATRQLKSVKIGFEDVTGTIGGVFNTFSGDLEISGTSTAYHRSYLGNRTFQLTNSELSLSINVDGPNKGIWYTIDNAQIIS
jgi:hypothetical protein